MKIENHKDLGRVIIEVIYEGDDNRIALVRANSKLSYNDKWSSTSFKVYKSTPKEYFYCLWGSKAKDISTMAVVPCITPTGRAQRIGPSMKLFNQMVNNTPKLIMT